MADRGQQRGALFDVPLDAAAHVEEGCGRTPHLLGTVRLEGRDIGTATEGFCGIGQALDGTHLIADEQDRDSRQQHRSQGHPEHEDVALGGEGALSRCQHAHHPAGHADTDIDIGRIAGGIEPEWRVQPFG